ncbi:hypothetical protein J6590_040187 [Homalodisca vitripennis]|nr:hypothetical protein J6590_040187 [Homalodisca vitripennis]
MAIYKSQIWVKPHFQRLPTDQSRWAIPSSQDVTNTRWIATKTIEKIVTDDSVISAISVGTCEPGPLYNGSSDWLIGVRNYVVGARVNFYRITTAILSGICIAFARLSRRFDTAFYCLHQKNNPDWDISRCPSLSGRDGVSVNLRCHVVPRPMSILFGVNEGNRAVKHGVLRALYWDLSVSRITQTLTLPWESLPIVSRLQLAVYIQTFVFYVFSAEMFNSKDHQGVQLREMPVRRVTNEN